MNWHRVSAMARKELIQVVRDWRSLAIVILMPVILMLLFGYGVSLDQKHVPIYVFDREGSQQSRDLLARFAATEYFRVVRAVDNYPDLVAAIDTGKCKMGVVVPPDFSKLLAKGGPVPVQALVDATDDNAANVVMGYVEAIVRSYSAEVQLEWLRQQGQLDAAAPLVVQARTWFNEDLQSRAFIVPGVLALVMAVIGAFLTSLTIAREWERGSMEQLISTPVTPLEVMLGKLGPYFLIGMVDAVICAAIAIYWLKVPFRGSAGTLLACSALFLIVVLSQGFVISVVARSQLAASQAALVSTFLPAFLLSGFLFSIEQMPRFIQVVSHLIPARYYVAALKNIFLKGSGLEQLTSQMAPLAIFAVVLALVATRAFKKQLE